MKKEKNWEWVLAIVIMLVVFAVVTPLIVKIVFNSQVDAAEASADAVVREAKTVYTEKNLNSVISLPFEVKYENDGKDYIVYSNGEELKNIKIRLKGKEPKSGSVIINKDGSISIIDLKLGLIVCNKEAKDSTLTCDWAK